MKTFMKSRYENIHNMKTFMKSRYENIHNMKTFMKSRYEYKDYNINIVYK